MANTGTAKEHGHKQYKKSQTDISFTSKVFIVPQTFYTLLFRLHTPSRSQGAF